MNSDHKRHSSCSRLRLLRSRTQPMHGRKFAASSLSASASPWRQRERRKWRWAPTAREASLKVFVSAAVPAGRKTIDAGPWRLFGGAQRCESKKREALWLVILFLKASGTASHVCSIQSINEVVSNLNSTLLSDCTVDAFTASGANIILFPQRGGRALRGAETEETWLLN